MSDTDLPSDEAVEAAGAVLVGDGNRWVAARRALTAAYAIDVPRIRAEVRAATLREVVAWLRENWNDLCADAVGHAFDPETEPSHADPLGEAR